MGVVRYPFAQCPVFHGNSDLVRNITLDFGSPFYRVLN